MTKRESKELVVRWQTRPLCRKYACCIFREMRVPVQQSEVGPELTAYWGLGSVPNGEVEILGAWMQRGSADAVPLAVFGDLCQRGVEIFGVLAGCGAIGQAAHGTSQLSITGIRCQHVLPPFEVDLGESDQSLALRPIAREALTSAGDMADEIQRRLVSAMARHGAVADGVEALDFVAEFLERADSRLYQLRTIRSILLPRPVAAGVPRRIAERAVTMPPVRRCYP